MKDDQIPHAGLSRHDAGLPRREMIAVARFFGVDVEIRRFAVEQVRMLRKSDDSRLIVFIVAGVHHLGQFLAF